MADRFPVGHFRSRRTRSRSLTHSANSPHFMKLGSKFLAQLEDCWAKTRLDNAPALSVQTHCLIVGAIASEILADLPPFLATLFPPELATLAALHDVGKITVGFQLKSTTWAKEHFPDGFRGLADSVGNHAQVSQAFLQDPEVLSDDLQPLAEAVGAHHGRHQASAVDHEELEEEFKSLRADLYQNLLDAGFPTLPTGTAETPPEELGWAIAGCIVVSDWIGSNEHFFPPPKSFRTPTPNLKATKAAAREVLEGIGWNREKLSPTDELGSLFGFESLNPLQTAALETITEPGLYLIEAPMGGGKTEAALAAAHQLITSNQARGLYFALPTQLTSNLIHRRVSAFLEAAGADGAQALAHSASWLVDPTALQIASGGTDEGRQRSDADEHNARPWFTSRKALLSNFGTGTIDQALMGTLPVRFFFLRLFGLAGKVVIFDEVHSYDAYTGSLLDLLIGRLLNLKCTVIILSATLTERRRTELLELSGSQFPCATIYEATGRARLVTLRHEFLQKPDLNTPLLELIAKEALSGKCVVIIRNTVQLAQDTFQRLASILPEADGFEIGLLHSRFPYFERNGHPDLDTDGREDHWVRLLGKDPEHRPKGGCVLVSTQVIEQSVDVSADLLITDLCPTDQLLQRVGRLHRHEFKPGESCACEPEAWILHPSLPTLPKATAKEIRDALRPHSYLYSPFVLTQTSGLFTAKEVISLPEDISPLLEDTYSYEADQGDRVQADLGDGMAELFDTLQSESQDLKDKAKNLGQPAAHLSRRDTEQNALTRNIEQQTVDLVLLAAHPSCHDKTHQVSPLDGTFLQNWHELEPWNPQLAAAIFRNTCRIPRHFVDTLPSETPSWLAKHAGHNLTVIAVCGDGGVLELLNGATVRDGTELRHSSAMGVHRAAVEDQQSAEESDEFEALHPRLGLDGFPE